MPCTNFMIVGKNDTPIYEVEISDRKNPTKPQTMKQFIMHAAMDPLDEMMWTSQALYLKSVDKFNEFVVSAYVTPGYIKFLIMQV